MMEYQEILDMVITGILIPIITYGGFLLKSFITAQIKSIKNKSEMEYVNDYLDKINVMILDVVTEVKSTFVDVLKNGGLFDEEKQNEAYEKALETIKAQLKREAYEILENVYVDAELYIQSKIQRAIEDSKTMYNKD